MERLSVKGYITGQESKNKQDHKIWSEPIGSLWWVFLCLSEHESKVLTYWIRRASYVRLILESFLEWAGKPHFFCGKNSPSKNAKKKKKLSCHVIFCDITGLFAKFLPRDWDSSPLPCGVHVKLQGWCFLYCSTSYYQQKVWIKTRFIISPFLSNLWFNCNWKW